MRQLPPIESCAECGMTRAGTCPFHETRLAAGSVLVAQGEKPDRVWLVRRGTHGEPTPPPPVTPREPVAS